MISIFKFPIIWKYLLSQYFKVLIFCVIAFIAVLLTTRMDDIAHFAALGAEIGLIFKFTFYQIPYVLPIAIPISCLISAMILIQRLSQSHELTALRSCGMALHEVLAPILIASAFISIGNFYIVSEMATESHLQTNLLKNKLRSVNPLHLLHNKHLMKIKGIYFETFGPSHLGESAEDVVLGIPNNHNNRINLLLAKKLEANPDFFDGEGMTFITSMTSDKREIFDQIAIENIGHSRTSIDDFSLILQKKISSMHPDHLKISLLRLRRKELKEAYAIGTEGNRPEAELKPLRKEIKRSTSEIIRRVSIAVSVLTFTLMGLSFGVSISRNRSNLGVFIVIGLAAFYLIAYFVAKAIDYRLHTASTLYLVPHFVIIVLSMWILGRISRGVE